MERRQRRQMRWSTLSLQLSLNLSALGLFAVVVVFVQATYSAEWRSKQKVVLNGLMKINVSKTLAITRAAQGLLTAITYNALKDAFIFLQWTLTNSPDGISYHGLLALSPTTGSLGTIALLRTTWVAWGPKLWALLRVTLTVVVWLAGLLLFFDTSIATVYDTAETYNVAAGVGPFNGSLVGPFKQFLQKLSPGYPFEVLPYSQFASAYILVANPLISTIAEPVNCQEQGCSSYLFSGGLSMVAPWVVLQGNPDFPMVKIDNTPSVQLDFSRRTNASFSNSDCDIFGESGVAIAIRFCVAEAVAGTLVASLSACTDGADSSECHAAASDLPHIITAVSFYTRQATVVAARSNYSIVSIEDTSPAVPFTDIDLSAYREAIRWILNFTAADIPAPSSIAQSFWSSADQLKNPSTYGIVEQNFQSILAFPFWMFNANNWGNTALRSNEITPGLPSQFYTTASIVVPYDKLRFDNRMFSVFVTLQGLSMLFVWGVLVWVWWNSSGMPVASSYPVFDAAFKAKVDSDWKYNGLQHADSYRVIEAMKGARAVVKAD